MHLPFIFLARTPFGQAEILLAAWRTRDGRLIDPGLVYFDRAHRGFPRKIYGGSWKSVREALARLSALDRADNLSATVLGWELGKGATFIDVDPPELQEGVSSPPSLADLISQAESNARERWGDLIPT